jgi:O-antigen/teichoic acid export membrane protein
MELQEKAAKSGIWFAAISFLTQAVSWAFTFYVIRLLDPKDYGLMTMASFLTAYLQVFAGLGLGSAIVQRETITEREVNSVFWFSLAFGVLMGLVAFMFAYPTAWLFDEPRVIPVTQLVGVLFVISALTTVPHNLLTRQFELKKVALINMVAVLVSSVASVGLALQGYGVYTLIWANIILNSLKMILLFGASGFRPKWHYSHREVRPYLGYGLYLALSGAAMRLFQMMDKLIVGKLFGATQLGLYGNAMTIASMPIDKISPVYQQVSFPLFARLQTSAHQYYESYLEIARHYLLVMSPIYLGSIVVSSELIHVVLGEKWMPMALMFQAFCVVKLFEVLTSYQSVLFNATGRHRSVFWFNLVLVVLIPAGIYIAARHSFEATIWPWITLYPLACLIWLLWGLHKAELSVLAYLRAIFDGTKAALLMFAVLWIAKHTIVDSLVSNDWERLVVLIVIGAVIFVAFLMLFQRTLVDQAMRTLRWRSAPT